MQQFLDRFLNDCLLLFAMKVDTRLPFEKIQRKIIVRREAETSPKFGKHPEDRTTEEIIHYGIININKPAGPTSHQVTAYARDILSLKKAGHSGTLDPMVTGVLPIGLERATKVMHLLLTAGKEYVAIMHLHNDLDEDLIVEGLNSLVGTITQLPPVKSAVKRVYRKRKVYYVEILEIDGRDVLFRVGVEAGTYIRKLIHDFGVKMRVGAHMAKLRRTKVGPFKEDSIFTLNDLSDAYYYYKEENNDSFLRKIIQPVEKAVSHLPKVWVMDSAVDSLCHGAALKVPGISKLNDNIQERDLVAILTLKDELIAYGTAVMSSKSMLGNKGLAVTVDKVFVFPGTYPRMGKKK